MEAARFWSVASLAFVLVLCITSTSVTWHCLNEVARLQSRVERLEAEDKGISVSQLLGQLGVQTPVYQGDGAEEDIPGHQREVRQIDPFRSLIIEIVREELEAHLNCSTDEETKCTIEPGPKGDPGPPGPQGETGPQGKQGERGDQGMQGYPGFKGQKGELGDQGPQGVRGERGEKGDMGTRGPVGERGDTGPIGPQGAKGEKGQLGYPGYKGCKGDIGAQGVRGPVGETGEKGDRGPQGPSGGEKGEVGSPGPKGQTGAKGEKGQLGHTGYKGEKGTTGAQGVKGMIGRQGNKGDTGDRGLVGGKGDMGDQGPQGIRGERGEKGGMGTRGPEGEKGERGDTGLTGAEGAKGQPGDPGSKGSSGEKGQKGERGEKGEAGEQGLPGQPGPKGDSPGLGPYTCGGTTGWHQVAYLDMTNSSHQCPGDMVEFTMSGKRVCGRSSTAPRQSCVSATFSTSGLQYSQVCGSIRGYQYGDPDAFYARASQSIEFQYVDGVSVTHGPPGSREHVWTFATGLSEDHNGGEVCPCAPNADLSYIRVPPFVGQDYFCESGFSTGYPTQRVLYSNDPLWDGDGCTVAGNTCCQFNNPPYFTKQLDSTTHNDLEVRACGFSSQSDSGEDILIKLIALYIKA